MQKKVAAEALVPPTATTARRNRLLRALPQPSLARLLPALEPMRSGIKEKFYEVDQPIAYVYFVLDGVASMLALDDDGKAIEIATVGNEGMVGLPAFLGAETAPIRTIMQVPGDVLRLRADTFRRHIADDPDLIAILHRYTQALLTQISQSSACNRLHSTEERCARWLITTHDRVAGDTFPLTHEFLAQMLGVRRATVSQAAGALQAAGVITYARGIVHVLDRARLEQTSCECYGIIAREYDRLLGAHASRKQAQAVKRRGNRPRSRRT